MNTLQKNSNNTLNADQTYHYELRNNDTYEKNDLHSITLKCCIFSSCHFRSTMLADSDWDSCQVEKCIFENLSLENSDITSTYFRSCIFENVSFKGTTTTDITFTNCKFIDCNFNHIGLSSSLFENCKFINLKLRQSTTTLNTFDSCVFNDSKIAGNFLYNLFLRSSFNNTTISKNIIAANVGFTKENLNELSLDKVNFKNLQQELLDKKDVIGAAIISINVDEKFCDYSIWMCMQAITGQLKNNILVRVEQLLFLKTIIDNLLITRQISLYTTVGLLNLLEKVKYIEDNIAIKKAMPTLQQIQNLLLEYYHQIINQLHDNLQNIKIENKPIQLKITYEKEPTIPICSLLEQMMRNMDILGNYPVRIKTEIGSFIEWIQCYDNIFKCLQLLVSVLGLGINIIKAKKTNTKPESNKEESNYSDTQKNYTSVDTTSNPAVFQIPESVIKQLNMFSTEQNVHQTINIFAINNMSIDNNFQGYNNFNIKEIEIL